MSDTFFSGAPHWTWFIIPYFYVGGLAGGAYFLAAVLDWFGGPEDRPVVRTGYNVAAVGAILSGALLTIDLGQPLRFWRSEEHTSELQSRLHLVCRLLLEKKKQRAALASLRRLGGSDARSA